MGNMSITKRILLYIEDNLDKELSLEKIAREADDRFFQEVGRKAGWRNGRIKVIIRSRQ